MAFDAVVEPLGFYAGATVTPAVRIINNGSASQSNIPVYVTADSAGTVIYSANTTVAGPLAAGDTATATFTGSFYIPSKGILYTLTAWTALSGDQFAGNDTGRLSGYSTGAPNRYFKFEWAFPHHTIYAG